MACELPPRQCLEWHIKPKLTDPRRAGDDEGYRARCPAHDDAKHSLGISIGDKQRVMWQCFTGCRRTRIRAELISKGVPPGCLPLVTKEREDMLDLLRQVLTADTGDHAGVRLRALAVLEGYSDLPRGRELERVAGLGHMNRVTAYRAKKSAPQRTDNPSSYGADRKPVKPRRSANRPDVA